MQFGYNFLQAQKKIINCYTIKEDWKEMCFLFNTTAFWIWGYGVAIYLFPPFCNFWFFINNLYYSFYQMFGEKKPL